MATIPMISPTGKGIRVHDARGSGLYGAKRGGRRHGGCDYVCEPGQAVVAPISGIVTRKAKPYAADKYGGLIIQGEHMTIKMFYLDPDGYLIGQAVKQGDVIGKAQDISKKYQFITPHIHLQVESVDPEIFTRML